MALRPDLAREICVLNHSADASSVEDFALLDAEHSRALSAIAEDASKPVLLRWFAAQATIKDSAPDAKWWDTVDGILSDPGWADAGKSYRWFDNELWKFVTTLDEPNELILRIVRHAELPLAPFQSSIMRFDRHGPRAAEIVRAILARWYDEPTAKELVQFTLRAMSDDSALADRETLARAARDPRYAGAALAAIGQLRDPAYLAVIEGLFRDSTDVHVTDAAALALLGYLSEEAGELLLVAVAKLPGGETRDKCLAQLEKIREYQDARERWATRKVRAQTREQVLADLFGQLSAKSDDVKVQAIRALATWEAVEAMPRLIELTSSGSKSVAAAAREALERLNAPK